VRGTFETFDARLKVGDGVFESPHAAVDLRMRKLDHRLRLGSGSGDFSVEAGGGSFDLVAQEHHGLGDELNVLPRPSVRTSK